MSKFQFGLAPKWYKESNVNSLVFIFFLMMSLVSSGRAVSVEHTFNHTHSVSAMAENSVSSHASHSTYLSDAEGNTYAKNGVIRKPAGPSEFSNTHCQHQGMSSQDAALTANSNANKMSQVGDAAFDSANAAQMDNMPCCKDECNCPADHCLNLSATALLQPTFETEVLVARMAATAPVLGQCKTLHFGQFRPPKSLLTA